jgi:hypothetical protein
MPDDQEHRQFHRVPSKISHWEWALLLLPNRLERHLGWLGAAWLRWRMQPCKPGRFRRTGMGLRWTDHRQSPNLATMNL